MMENCIRKVTLQGTTSSDINTGTVVTASGLNEMSVSIESNIMEAKQLPALPPPPASSSSASLEEKEEQKKQQPSALLSPSLSSSLSNFPFSNFSSQTNTDAKISLFQAENIQDLSFRNETFPSNKTDIIAENLRSSIDLSINDTNLVLFEHTTIQQTPNEETPIFGRAKPNLDLTKLYRKSSAKIIEPYIQASNFYASDSSSSNSISATMLSPEVVTNLTLLDHQNPESIIENLNKISIHHQDAEVSIADATDCLRQVGGKIDWYHRKQVFCSHLMTPDDAIQIAAMHQKILYEEIPFLELKNRLKEDTDCDFPRELEGKFVHVCGLFIELKNRIQDLINSLSEELLIAAGRL